MNLNSIELNPTASILYNFNASPEEGAAEGGDLSKFKFVVGDFYELFIGKHRNIQISAPLAPTDVILINWGLYTRSNHY